MALPDNASEDRFSGRYDAFISYSRKDSAFVNSLYKTLSSYSTPKTPETPARRLSIFRDTEDLVGADYYQSIKDNLIAARKLIVVCSPSAAQSSFVDGEVQEFLLHRQATDIIPILLDGTPNNEIAPGGEKLAAFPPSLCKALSLPLAINYKGFNTRRDRPNNNAWDSSWFSLLARLFDATRADIEQREKRRQSRQRRITTAVTFTVMLALALVAIFALISNRRLTQEQDRVRAREADILAKGLTEAGLRDIRRDTNRALLLTMYAVDVTYSKYATVRPEALTALRQALVAASATNISGSKIKEAGEQGQVLWRRDGKQAVIQQDNSILIDALSGTVIKDLNSINYRAAFAWKRNGSLLVSSELEKAIRVPATPSQFDEVLAFSRDAEWALVKKIRDSGDELVICRVAELPQQTGCRAGFAIGKLQYQQIKASANLKRVVLDGYNGGIASIDLDRGAISKTIDLEKSFGPMALSPNAKYLAIIVLPGQLQIFDAVNLTLVHSFPESMPFSALGWSADNTLFGATTAPEIWEYKPSLSTEQLILYPKEKMVAVLGISDDGSRLIVTDFDKGAPRLYPLRALHTTDIKELMKSARLTVRGNLSAADCNAFFNQTECRLP